MKSRNFWKWGLGVGLAVLPLVGCAPSGSATSANAAAATDSAVIATNAVTTNTSPSAETVESGVMSDEDLATAPARKITSAVALPPSILPGSPSAEVVKLANAGVDEGVMLTYVTNATSTFNLAADQIIYLKDIGVPESVVTAMIQRDRVVRAAGADVAPQPEAAAETSSNATHYWTPDGQPAAEGQQPASDVAPQFEGSEAQPVAVPQQPAEQVTYDNFNSNLSPYGTWLEIEGYGRVWQPTVVAVNPGWRPYYDGGRWIYTDYGWYWLSDYSWGWAPFHYGRWFRHHYHGWCWAPDLVWGPSWVSWRYYDSYCGWAPLPPSACWRPGFGFSYYGHSVGIGFEFGLHHSHYSFVHMRHFHNHHLHGHRLHDQHVNQIYNKTVVVNKIVGDNNVIINNGIAPERVSAVTRQEVRRVAVRPTSSPAVAGGRGERLDPSTRTVTVYRPQTAPVNNDSSSIVQRMARNEPRRSGAATPVSSSLAPASTRTTDREAVTRPQPNSGSLFGRTERPAPTSGSSPRTPSATEVTRPAAERNLFSTDRDRESSGRAMTRSPGATVAASTSPSPAPATTSITPAPLAPSAGSTSTTVRREAPSTESLIVRGSPQTAPQTSLRTDLSGNGNRSTPSTSGRSLFGATRSTDLERPSPRPTQVPTLTTPQPAPPAETPRTWARPEPTRPTPQPVTPTPAPQTVPRVENRWVPQPAQSTYSRPATPPPTIQRSEPIVPQRSMPAPAPTYRSEPRYSPPAPAPAPAPRNVERPAPVFSAPRAEPSRPAPSAAPAPSRSSGNSGNLFSGSRGRGRD